MTASSFILSTQDIINNLESLRQFMSRVKVDLFYISSFDPYLNEYTPLSNSHRYYFSGFTGSTSEMLIPVEGKALLFVDGRYHEQADLEVDHEYIEVRKCPQTIPPTMAMMEELIKQKENKVLTLGIEGDRCARGLELQFLAQHNVKFFDRQELASVVSFKGYQSDHPIYAVNDSLCGQTPRQKMEGLLKPGEAFYVSALDSIAWASNCRGFQLPWQSTFMARAIGLVDHLYVFVEPGAVFDPSANQKDGVIFECISYGELESRWQELGRENNIKKISYDPDMINGADFRLLERIFKERLVECKGGITLCHSVKNKKEIQVMTKDYNKANLAIYKTLSWVKDEMRKKKRITERDVYQKTTECFKKTGAVEQSFNTISAVGAHSSIMHFSKPEENLVIKPGTFVLLDCGGLYQTGMATDTTRTILAPGKKAISLQKEIYTLVLKGLLQAQNAIFTETTRGSDIDALARAAMFKKGYNYNHGTGHGIGINVHEGGIRLSPQSNTILRVGQTLSIEPGIYIPGFGGVRLENVVVVKKHPQFKKFLCFEPLVYIGFWPDLIDYKMLNSDELVYLRDYEKECKKRKTSFGK
ncbi:MAG: M24 family metallopeptidase [Pseudomonadota bacterium]